MMVKLALKVLQDKMVRLVQAEQMAKTVLQVRRENKVQLVRMAHKAQRGNREKLVLKGNRVLQEPEAKMEFKVLQDKRVVVVRMVIQVLKAPKAQLA
jgi:hypothetical protein